MLRRHGEHREITRLHFQTCEIFDLLIGDETGTGNACTQLTNQHLLLKQLAELQAGVAHLLNDLIETRRTESAFHLEFGGLQNQLIKRFAGESEVSALGTLQKQHAIDQRTERSVTQQTIIDQRGVEVLTQLLSQLASLHVHRLIQVVAGDFLTIDRSGVLAVAGGVEDGFEASQSQQHHDDADDGFGYPAL